MATLTIQDGRTELFQYDLNPRLVIADDDGAIDAVDFDDPDNSETLTVQVQTHTGSDGTTYRYVTIPSELLNGQYSKLTCFTYDSFNYGDTTSGAVNTAGVTRQKFVFRIRDKEVPATYTVPETELLSLTTAVDEAKKWATGIGTNGSAVVDGDAQYQNNSEYYAGQASGYYTSAKESAELAQAWASQTDGYVSGEYYSAYKVAKDLNDSVGTPSDSSTSGTVFGNIAKAVSDAKTAIGESDTTGLRGKAVSAISTAKSTALEEIGGSNTEGARGDAVEALNEYAITGTNSLKAQLHTYATDSSTGLIHDLDAYESSLETEFQQKAKGENLDYNGGWAGDIKAELNTYTTGTGSSQMFGKLQTEEKRLEGVLDDYTNGDMKSVLDDYAVGDEVRGKIDSYAEYKESVIASYIEEQKDGISEEVSSQITTKITEQKKVLDNYVGNSSDTASPTGTLMAQLNQKRDDIKSYVGDTTDVADSSGTLIAQIKSVYASDLAETNAEVATIASEIGVLPVSDSGADLESAIAEQSVALTDFVGQFESAPTEETTADLVTALKDQTIALGNAVNYLIEKLEA